MKNKGFSIFEVVVYIAIVSVVMVSILAIAAESMSSRVKTVAMQQVNYQSQFVLSRLTNDVRAATEIDVTAFAADILTVTLADGTTHRYEVIANQLTLSVNGATPVALTTTAVTVDTFALENRTPITVSTAIHDVAITLSLSSAANNVSPNYAATQTLTTSVSTRL